MVEMTRQFSGRQVIARAGVAAGAGAAVWALAMVVDTQRAMFAYLVVYSFAVSIAVGALILLMIGYATGARWMSVIRRLTETIALAVIPLAVLFLPIAVWIDEIYVWAAPHADLSDHAQHLIDHKRPYLNQPMFIARAAIYFGCWITAAGLLRRWSLRRDGAGGTDGAAASVDSLGKERALSSALLPAVGFAMTFASFDWLMSLQPEWLSSIFGIYWFAGGFLAAIALVAVLARCAEPALAGAVTRHHFHALGRLLLGFSVFWAYIAFFQAMLIKIADRPEEVTFYLARTSGTWGWLAAALVGGHFALPFLLLLPRAWKFSSRFVATVAGWLIAMHFLDSYWLVIPAHERSEIWPHWADIGAFAAIGGLVVAFCAWTQHRVDLVASGDPLLREGVAYQVPA